MFVLMNGFVVMCDISVILVFFVISVQVISELGVFMVICIDICSLDSVLLIWQCMQLCCDSRIICFLFSFLSEICLWCVSWCLIGSISVCFSGFSGLIEIEGCDSGNLIIFILNCLVVIILVIWCDGKVCMKIDICGWVVVKCVIVCGIRFCESVGNVVMCNVLVCWCLILCVIWVMWLRLLQIGLSFV